MRLIELHTLTAEDRGAWDLLAERAVEPNPFFERLFVPAAATALEAEEVGLLVADDGGAWSGCMPVQIRRALGRGILASTWKHPYSFLGTPLVDRDRVEEFAATLMRTLREKKQFRYLLMRRLSDGPILAALRRAAEDDGRSGPVFERSFERGAYEGRPPEEQLGWMKSRRRSELKRQRRRLAETLGEETAIQTREDTVDAVAAFLDLEASGWKGAEGTAMASDARSAELFRAMCGEFADRGRLRIRALQAGDKPLAMTCDVSAGGVLFGFKSAYDESLRKYSPGVQLQVENFAGFDAEHEESLFDSCAEPDNEMINGLWPDRRPIVTIAFGGRGPTGKLLGRALDSAYETRRKRASGDGETPPKR